MQGKLVPLLDAGINVLAYSGDADFICNWYVASGESMSCVALGHPGGPKGAPWAPLPMPRH